MGQCKTGGQCGEDRGDLMGVNSMTCRRRECLENGGYIKVVKRLSGCGGGSSTAGNPDTRGRGGGSVDIERYTWSIYPLSLANLHFCSRAIASIPTKIAPPPLTRSLCTSEPKKSHLQWNTNANACDRLSNEKKARMPTAHYPE